MGSGESDVKYIGVDTTSTAGDWQKYFTAPSTAQWSPSYTTYYTSPIYMYQVRCPKRGCRKMNWMQLDIITPCKNCGAKLKAVSEVPEFTIPVDNS